MISDEIQKDLRIKYNPEKSLLREQQNRMSRILAVVAEICEREGIDYWLTHGTLLGAVRHGGFIPWDDDVDICIFRRDRDKFQSCMRRFLPPDMALQSHITDGNYYHPYYKIRDLNSEIWETGNEDVNYKYRGIYIDVFPVELAHQSVVRNSFRMWGRILYHIILPQRLTLSKTLRNKCLFYFFSLLFSLCRLLERVIPNKKWSFPFGCYFRTGFLQETIIPLTKKVRFEDRLYACPNDSDSYLKLLYGDYNKLPPEEQMHPHTTAIKL